MVRRVPGPACGAHGVTAMDIRPAELQNSRGPPGTPPVEDNGDLGNGSGVGIEEVTVQAGVGALNQSFFKSGARLVGIDACPCGTCCTKAAAFRRAAGNYRASGHGRWSFAIFPAV